MSFLEKLYEILNRKFRNAQLARMWFISYSLILLLLILIFLVTFVYTDRMIYNNLIAQNSEIALSQVDIINRKFGNIVNIAAQISNYSQFKAASEYGAVFSDAEKYSIFLLFQDISGYQQSDVEIEDVFFYFPNSEKIVYFGGECTPEFYYASQKVGAEADFQTWFSTVSDANAFGFFTSSQTAAGNAVYYKYFPLQPYEAGKKPAIFFKINPQKLLHNTANSQIFITNNQFEPLFLPSGSDTALAHSVDFAYAKSNTELTYAGQKLISFSTDMPEWELHYFSFADKDAYFRQLHTIRLVLFLALLLMTILGELFLFFMVRMNALPIHTIALKLKNRFVQAEQSANELQFISSAVSDTLVKNEVYAQKIDVQQEYFLDNFLYKMATGYIQAAPNKLFDAANIRFDYDYFLIMAVSVGNLNELYFEKAEDLHKSAYDAQFIIKNIFVELFSADYIIYAFSNQNMPLFILNLGDNSAAATAHIKTLLSEITQFVQVHFNLVLTVGISDIHETLDGIPEAYEEALSALDQSFIIPDSIISYNAENADTAPAGGGYYFPLEREEVLTNGLLQGDYALCEKHINAILDVNFSQYHLSLAYAKLLIMDIVGTFVKAINNVTSSSNMLRDLTEEAIQSINACQSVGETKEKIFELLAQFCDYTQKNIVTPNSSLAGKVVQFVENYYNDPDLNVSMISAHFDVTSSYLSSTFKKNMNMGLLEYITSVRLDQAKHMIVHTNDTFETIAVKVGISNVRTFFRIFQKYVGISPGKYRELNTQE